MKLRRYIVFMWVFITLLSAPVIAQEYLAVVCAGDTGVSYSVVGGEGSTFEWVVDGGEIVRDYNDSIVVDWGIDAGEFEIMVQETSIHGCISEPRIGTIFVSRPAIELGDDTYVCEGEVFSVSPVGEDHYYSYDWHNGSENSSYSTNIEELISLRVSDSVGCYWSDELYLEVKSLPEVELGNDTSLCGEQSLYLDAGFNASYYSWSTGDQSQSLEVFQGRKEIWVDVEDEFGCMNFDTIQIFACDPDVFFSDSPTAITPNGDGRNDTWVIDKLNAYPDAIVEIFDRWGRLVFRSEPGYTIPWDGTDLRGGKLPADSYHYVILLNFGGSEDRVNGVVTVIR